MFLLRYICTLFIFAPLRDFLKLLPSKKFFKIFFAFRALTFLFVWLANNIFREPTGYLKKNLSLLVQSFRRRKRENINTHTHSLRRQDKFILYIIFLQGSRSHLAISVILSFNSRVKISWIICFVEFSLILNLANLNRYLLLFSQLKISQFKYINSGE